MSYQLPHRKCTCSRRYRVKQVCFDNQEQNNYAFVVKNYTNPLFSLYIFILSWKSEDEVAKITLFKMAFVTG